MDPFDAEQVVGDLWLEFLQEREKSQEWQRWALGRQEMPDLPDTASNEYADLQDRASTPWLSLVVQSVVQALFVEGYRRDGDTEDMMLWAAWQANRMDARQSQVYDAAGTTGVAYVAVLPTGAPGERRRPLIDGTPMVPEWRTYSSDEMTAFYESPHDEWPVYALAGQEAPAWKKDPSLWTAQLVDDELVHQFVVKNGRPAFIESTAHGVGHVPLARFVNRQTISGRAVGEVEPYTALAARIDQDVFDRLIVQRFAAWRVKWATGMVVPKDDEERKKLELMLTASGILVNEGTEGKFGSLPETPMDGHLRAAFDDVRMLAAVSQTPPTVLTGDLSNISADALAAIEAAFNRKIEQRKVSYGESWEQCFDLTSRLMGITQDSSAQVRWRDMESRALSQLADAFGKLATQLELPVEVLWDKVPFLTDQDRERAKSIRDSGAGMGDLLLELQRGQTSPTVDAVTV